MEFYSLKLHSRIWGDESGLQVNFSILSEEGNPKTQTVFQTC